MKCSLPYATLDAFSRHVLSGTARAVQLSMQSGIWEPNNSANLREQLIFAASQAAAYLTGCY